MRLSIVIASHNEGGNLAKTVRSCVEGLGRLDAEVVVADDASTDGSIEALAREFPEVRVFTHPERLGASPTKDLAARSARGEVVVLMDGHCKPEPGFFARMVDDVEATCGRAVITPAVAPLDADTWETNLSVRGNGGTFDLERFGFRWEWVESLRRSDEWRGRGLLESPAASGCCLAMSAALYRDVLGVDPDMRMWGVEDVDFSLKTWLMGYSILHDPAAVVGHRFRSSFDTYSVPLEHVHANTMRMARRNFTGPVWRAWVRAFRAGIGEAFWGPAWALFGERRESAEAERDTLMARRHRDEFWFAEHFGIDFPAALAAADPAAETDPRLAAAR